MSRFIRVLRRQAIGLLALCIALGGTAYAATAIKPNSVGSRQIKNSSIASVDVKNGALLAADFKRGQLPAGATGPAGAPGQAGPQGAPGAPGAAGPAGRSALAPLQSGETVRGVVALDFTTTATNEDWSVAISLPIPAPVPIDSSSVAVKAGEGYGLFVCAGTYEQPTAPPGKGCVYSNSLLNPSLAHTSATGTGTPYGFGIRINPQTVGDAFFRGSWAYTAP